MVVSIIKERRQTKQVSVGNVIVGSTSPIVVQSMTNTDTKDVGATVSQIKDLVSAGSEIVRITVNDDAAAIAVPKIKEALKGQGITVPIVGCFHYNGHYLLEKYPDCAAGLDKYRVNPGNVGSGYKRDANFEAIIKIAIKHNKPIRIGVNWGSLDQDLMASLMDANAQNGFLLTNEQIMHEAMVKSALSSAKKAEAVGLAPDKIIISAKVSRVQDLVAVYRDLAAKCDYPLHLGLTEAGPSSRGIVATTSAMSILLQEGIGDTIRASLTPKPGGPRDLEVKVCQDVLQSLGIRSFVPMVSACPGCGRTSSTYFQELAEEINGFIELNMPVWKIRYPGVEAMNIAVMGCIVNGPGESKHADIGISLPGNNENPVAPVFIDGIKRYTLRGDDIAKEFKAIMLNYIEKKYEA